MTVSDEWKPFPGARHYEFSHRGKARSLDRRIGGKFYTGRELPPRLNNQGYVLVDIRMDDGSRQTITMHRGVLLSHHREPGPGEECCHGPGGPLDNRWPENIRWGTREENLADMAAARPAPEPKPPKVCPRCKREHEDRGRICVECRKKIGRAAAILLAENPDLPAAAAALGYPSAEGVFRLAVEHGGARITISDGHATSPVRALRRVINRREASRRNSDAR